MKLKSEFLQELVDRKTIVKVSYYIPGDSHKTHYFKGIIRSYTNKGIQLYSDLSGKLLFVRNQDIVILSALKTKPMYPADNAGLESMGRGKEDKRPHYKKFSYSTWWKNSNIREDQ